MNRRSAHAAVQVNPPAQSQFESTPIDTSVGAASQIGAASCGSVRLSDADITRSAQGTLQSITLLAPGSIMVVVDGGWITLSGNVHWNYQKEAAAAAARHVIGATGVTVRVSVNDTGPAPANRSPFGPFVPQR